MREGRDERGEERDCDNSRTNSVRTVVLAHKTNCASYSWHLILAIRIQCDGWKGCLSGSISRGGSYTCPEMRGT